MKRQYLIRLDDACPTMNHERWGHMEAILDTYDIKPLVGVIPHNEDPRQLIDLADTKFWSLVNAWEQKGWAIALHGYNHCYTSKNGLKGLNPFWKYSEFAGLPIEVQREKIRLGVSIMQENSIFPKYFFAPGHTFDENTLTALRDESDIRIISDTIARKPYRYGNFIFIPQFGGHCQEMKIPGIFTFCLHPSTMSNESFDKTAKFLQNHSHEFTSFDALYLKNVGKKSCSDKILTYLFFFFRKIKGANLI